MKILRLNKYQWHNWFAWYPVIAVQENTEINSYVERTYWVWLETVERIKLHRYMYRIK